MVLTNDDQMRRLATLYLDKCYDREGGKRNPFFLAPNYQMTELQGAVALAQLKKLTWIIEQRRKLGDRLTTLLKDIPGITAQLIPDGCRHTYFLFLFRVDTEMLHTTTEEFSKALDAEGIPNQANMITGGMPEYAYDIFKNLSAFPDSQHPFVNETFGTNVSYQDVTCPHAEKAFEQVINLQINEFYTEKDVDEMAQAVEKVANYYYHQSL